MKKLLLTFACIVLIVVGAAWNSGRWGSNSIYGDYTFNDNIWLAGDTLFLTDGGEDANYIVNDGSNVTMGGDNNIVAIVPFYIGSLLAPLSDTTMKSGSDALRWKEVWGLRLQWSDGTKADSGKIYGDGTSDYLQIDNAAFKVITGTDTVSITGGTLAGTKLRGADTFGGTKTADTVLITGATANDLYWIQVKGSTVPTAPFTCVAKAGSLIVNCAEADTAIATAGGYNWIRLQ